MISKEQVYSLAKKKKMAEAIIFREYLQVLFLSELYSKQSSRNIFFKGGTALHLLYGAPRFSEDLDFTSGIKEKDFLNFIEEVFKNLSQKEAVQFKEKRSTTGKKFLLTALPSIFPYKTFVRLDFSFREKVISPQKSIIETDYPVLFTSYVYHLSKDEIFAEKIRALLTRAKGRDFYDLWYLLNRGAKLNKSLVKEKLKYYNLENINREEILKRINKFSKKDFILDMSPLVSFQERKKLGKLFDYIKDYLNKSI